MLIERLDISPEEAFFRLRGLAMPFIFSGGHDNSSGAYSFVSADPLKTIKTVGGRTTVNDSGREVIFKDPFEALSKTLRGLKKTEGPFPFNSGAFGYFSYDLKGLIEPSASLPAVSDEAIPELMIGVYDPVFVYDRGEAAGRLVSVSGNAERFERFKGLLLSGRGPLPGPPHAALRLSSNMTKDEYLSMIQKALEYISAGDIYQINLSQRLEIKWEGDPLALFLSLERTHPAPFNSLFDLGVFQILSNSPERLLKVSGATVETSPIKGTRPSGKTPEEDRKLINELKGSLKERAEHVMIVDLERNDLGRISVAGSVEVAEFGKIESYRHLHHMISTVRGTLKPEVDAPSALRAVFPGGSVTGAPKIRAMEIIEELEPVKRGVYTGGIGWMDSNGGMDIAMAIRTAVYRDGAISLHVGGGIVADSVPEEEYAETLLKARDFLTALGIGSSPEL